MSRGELLIGTSGYQYDHWKGRFYPEELARSERFEHYAGVFSTVEINNTFYGLPPWDRSWSNSRPIGKRIPGD